MGFKGCDLFRHSLSKNQGICLKPRDIGFCALVNLPKQRLCFSWICYTTLSLLSTTDKYYFFDRNQCLRVFLTGYFPFLQFLVFLPIFSPHHTCRPCTCGHLLTCREEALLSLYTDVGVCVCVCACMCVVCVCVCVCVCVYVSGLAWPPVGSRGQPFRSA